MGGSGSHCWEPDGSFHVVCMFVIGASSVCGVITIFSVYRIILMVISAIRSAVIGSTYQQKNQVAKLSPILNQIYFYQVSIRERASII